MGFPRPGPSRDGSGGSWLLRFQPRLGCNVFSGFAAYWSGSPEKLLPQMELSLERSGGLPVAHAYLGLALALRGRPQEGLASVETGTGALDLTGVGIKGPSSTWTYLVNDNSFRHQLGRLLSGPGQATLGIGAALSAAPLFILWALVDRFFRRRPRL